MVKMLAVSPHAAVQAQLKDQQASVGDSINQRRT